MTAPRTHDSIFTPREPEPEQLPLPERTPFANPYPPITTEEQRPTFTDEDLFTAALYDIACDPQAPRAQREGLWRDYQTEQKAKVILPEWGYVSVKETIDYMVFDQSCNIEREGPHFHLVSHEHGVDWYLGKGRTYVVDYAEMAIRYRTQDEINHSHDGQMD
jgi:hypothetical protein